MQAEMETIEPIQMDRRFEFRWFGVEAARNQQQIQMKMAGMNVLITSRRRSTPAIASTWRH